jgi:hypothetical protein
LRAGASAIGVVGEGEDLEGDVGGDLLLDDAEDEVESLGEARAIDTRDEGH